MRVDYETKGDFVCDRDVSARNWTQLNIASKGQQVNKKIMSIIFGNYDFS